MTSTITTRNGVDTAALFATINPVAEQPELGRFQFRASNRWISGTHNQSTINGFYGAGQQHTRAQDHTLDADHPAVLCGEDNGPTPAELLLRGPGRLPDQRPRQHRRRPRHHPDRGHLDRRGRHRPAAASSGITDEVRNGFERIRVHFTVAGDGTAEQLAALVEQAERRSAVFDVLTNGVPVEIDVTTR